MKRRNWKKKKFKDASNHKFIPNSIMSDQSQSPEETLFAHLDQNKKVQHCIEQWLRHSQI